MNLLDRTQVIEGMLLAYDTQITLQTDRKLCAQGWASEISFPLSEIVNIVFKPGGFASGGHITFQCARDNFELKVNFSLSQSANASVFISRLEKTRATQKNPVLLTANGVNGQIELIADRIRIKRGGTLAVLGHGLKGDKEIQLSSISSIQFRTPGSMTNGYIQFAFFGGTEAKSALFGATQDENSVMFSTAQMPVFVQMKAAIEEQKKRTESQNSAPVVQFSQADELEKLASLRDRGILSDDEFTAKKKQILGL